MPSVIGGLRSPTLSWASDRNLLCLYFCVLFLRKMCCILQRCRQGGIFFCSALRVVRNTQCGSAKRGGRALLISFEKRFLQMSILRNTANSSRTLTSRAGNRRLFFMVDLEFRGQGRENFTFTDLVRPLSSHVGRYVSVLYRFIQTFTYSMISSFNNIDVWFCRGNLFKRFFFLQFCKVDQVHIVTTHFGDFFVCLF